MPVLDYSINSDPKKDKSNLDFTKNYYWQTEENFLFEKNLLIDPQKDAITSIIKTNCYGVNYKNKPQKLDYKIKAKDEHQLRNIIVNNKWEGIIEEITENIVYARMYDFGEDNEDFIEFNINDFGGAFTEEDIEEGDRFYLYVGYDEKPSRRNIALITFQKYYCTKPNQERIDEILSIIHKLKEEVV